MQPLGATVWEYLSSQCGSLFDYEYTKRMESDLDAIEGGEKVWHTLCSECDGEVTALTSEVREAMKKAKEAKKAKKSKKGASIDDRNDEDDGDCDVDAGDDTTTATVRWNGNPD